MRLLTWPENRDEAHGGTPRARRADIAFPHLQQDSLSPRGGQQLSPRTGHSGSKAGEQERRLTSIVHRHMKELLSIVAGSSTSVRISATQVNALGIVLMAPFSSDGRGRRLSQLLPWWRSGGHEAAAVADVAAWLQEALPAPQEPPHRSGAAASKSPGHADSPQLDVSAAERSGGIVLNQVYKTTLIRSALDLCPSAATQDEAMASTEQQWMRIQQCSECFIYITAPLSRVVISGCSNCTILIAAASLVTVEACQSIKLTVGCRRIHVSNSVDSTLYILTNRHPILLGENHDLILAPFNALMSECLALWRRLRVDRSRNRWAEPLWISRSGNNVVLSGGGETGVPGQSVMPPHNFFCITVPSHKPLPTSIVASQANPCPLPPAYASALQSKHKQVLDLRKEIAETEAVSAGGNKQVLHRAIQAKFKEWLVSSGNMRQVQDLIHMEHPQLEGVSSRGGAGGALSLHLP